MPNKNRFKPQFFIKKAESYTGKERLEYEPEQERIIKEFQIWLDTQDVIATETLSRFRENLCHELNVAGKDIKFDKREGLKITAQMMGHCNYESLYQRACSKKILTEGISLHHVKIQLKREESLKELKQQGLSDFYTFFFITKTEYVKAILDYLVVKLPRMHIQRTEDFFATFGPIYQNILMLPELRTIGIPEQQLKKLARKTLAWYLREQLPAQLMYNTCKTLPQSFRADFYKYKALSSLNLS